MKHAAPTALPRLLTRTAPAVVGVVSALALSTVALGAGPAIATGGGNVDCLPGETEIKYEASELTSDPTKSSGDFTVTVSGVERGEVKDESATPTVTTGSEVRSFDYTASAGLVRVIVKGSNDARLYENPPLQGFDLVAPVNNSGKNAGVSNVKFCFLLPTSSASPSASASPTASATPTASVSPSASVSPTASPSASVSPSASASTTASASPSASVLPTASVSPSASASPTVSASPSASPSVSPTGIGGTGGGGGTTEETPAPSVSPIGGSTEQPSTGEGLPTVEGSPIAGGSEEEATTDTTGQPSTLPFTGYDTDTAVLAAWGAVAAGFMLVLMGRRRRSLNS